MACALRRDGVTDSGYMCSAWQRPIKPNQLFMLTQTVKVHDRKRSMRLSEKTETGQSNRLF
ncbi:MAG: hypothetical protein P8X74_09320 [Reinekea sp.]